MTEPARSPSHHGGRRGYVASAALAIALALASAAARAQTPPPSDAARADFERGLALADAGNCARALPLFRRSYAANAANGPLFNLALCERDLGLVASAARHFEELVAKLPPDDDRLVAARDAVAALAPRVPHVRLRLPPAAEGAAIAIDGAPVARSALGSRLPLDPGDHVVRVTAPGRPANDVRFRIAEREDRELAVEPAPPLPLARSVVAPPVVGAATPAETDGSTDAGATPTWVWVTGALGLTAGALAIGLAADYGAVQGTIASDCPITNAAGKLVCDQRSYSLDDAHALQARRDRDLGLAIGLGAAGTAAVGAAVIGLVTARGGSQGGGSVGMAVVPWGARAGGAVLRGAF